MKDRVIRNIVLSAAVTVAAGTAWGAELLINPAIGDFEYIDLANTVAPTNDQLIADSEAWSGVISSADERSKASFSTTVTSGSFSAALGAFDEGGEVTLTSTNLGISLVDGNTYKFSIDMRVGISGTHGVLLEVYRASDDALIASDTLSISSKNIWFTQTTDFVAGATDAGQDIYLKFTRNYDDHNRKVMVIDNIVLEEIGSAFSDAARVLAFNVDAEMSDFEYVQDGIGMDLSIVSLDGASNGGSTDGSFGGFPDPVGANTNTPAAYPWAADGANSLTADITITNTSAQTLKLEGLYFDIYRNSSTSVRGVSLDYIDGDLGATGTVYDVLLQTTAAEGQWKNYSWTFGKEGFSANDQSQVFTALGDQRLAPGETASFRLVLETSTDAATEPDMGMVDNIALIGDFIEDGVIVDWGSPDMFFADQGNTDVRLQEATVTSNGTLIINNYVPAKPTFDNTLDEGFYQDQPLWAIYQTGNGGALSESTGFRYMRLAGGSPTDGALILNVETPTNVTDVYQSSLLYVKSEDFYDEIETGETLTSLSMNIASISGDSAAVRFAVQNDGQWYISFSKAIGVGEFVHNFPVAENAWAAFTPATSGSTSMASAGGLTFDVSGVIFTNVEAVGYFFEGEDLAESDNTGFKVEGFRVEIGAAPALPSSDVLAFNVDSNAYDFEYVKSGVDILLNVINTRSSGTSDGSKDGSYGSFFDPVGADTNSAAYPWSGRGDNLHIVEITVANEAPNSSLDMDGFYFDYIRRNTGALRRVELEYIGGDLTGVSSGLVYGVTTSIDEFIPYDETNVVDGVTNVVQIQPWADFDWTFDSEGSTPTIASPTFNALVDTTLSYGESATFRFSLIPETDIVTEYGQTWVDNIAFIGSLTPAGFGHWVDGFGLDPADTDPELDPDNDGYSNFDEYVRNGNPNDIGNTGTGTVFATDGSGFIYPVRVDDEQLVYTVETDDNLVIAPGWTNAGYTAMGTNSTGDVLNFVTNTFTEGKLEQFIRVTVEQL
ncbi:hypothetical protein [Pontiella sulfatireligans]|uniref:Uncharacterized protein n=1 Tax=Pontiella sulfatireligans TaxID=2750658 RepID=A0A6C2UD93_9BACT|nr:hypothetical protein [Pontiella sulfatireligans]VGO18158.1 hypothetical protein SCARR_00209 [Pontiella sulfatireligans]